MLYRIILHNFFRYWKLLDHFPRIIEIIVPVFVTSFPGFFSCSLLYYNIIGEPERRLLTSGCCSGGKLLFPYYFWQYKSAGIFLRRLPYNSVLYARLFVFFISLVLFNKSEFRDFSHKSFFGLRTGERERKR